MKQCVSCKTHNYNIRKGSLQSIRNFHVLLCIISRSLSLKSWRSMICNKPHEEAIPLELAKNNFFFAVRWNTGVFNQKSRSTGSLVIERDLFFFFFFTLPRRNLFKKHENYLGKPKMSLLFSRIREIVWNYQKNRNLKCLGSDGPTQARVFQTVVRSPRYFHTLPLHTNANCSFFVMNYSSANICKKNSQ